MSPPVAGMADSEFQASVPSDPAVVFGYYGILVWRFFFD